MKRLAALALVLLLTGCGKNDALNVGMELRSSILKAPGCSFTAQITADYGDILEEFTLEAEADSQGNVSFRVVKPESISGISGKLEARGGELVFDDTALVFPLLTDDQLSPVSAPWVLMRALRSGYLTSAGEEGEYTRLTIDDSYEEDAMTVDIWLEGQMPKQADILYDGRRILTISIKDFHILPGNA